MDMVFRIVPSMTFEHLSTQAKRAIILGICHVLVTVANLIFQVSPLPELANFLLLTCLFELLSCPKVKAQVRAYMGHEAEEAAEGENCPEPEDDEADCKKAKKVEDPDDVPTEAELTDEDVALSEVEMTSSAEEELASSPSDAECPTPIAAQKEVAQIEKPRWADLEEDDEDFLPMGTSASDNEPQSCPSTSDDSEPETNVDKFSEQSRTAFVSDTIEPERTLYKRSQHMSEKTKWRHSSRWESSSPKSKWDHSAPEQIVWKNGRSAEQAVWKHDRFADTMLYKRGSDYDSSSSEEEVTSWKSPNSWDAPAVMLTKKDVSAVPKKCHPWHKSK